jgi:replicative superfamily II helicase
MTGYNVDIMAAEELNVPRATVTTRGYQQELLQESLHRNIVIALDTGSGKTHIAMLRMKHEVEHGSKKVCIRLCVRSFSQRPYCARSPGSLHLQLL